MICDELNEFWLNLIVPYYQSADTAGELLEEIIRAHSGRERYYHNCEHLGRMLEHTVEYGHRLENVEVVRFATFYHDIVYRSSRRDNESKSAVLARKRLEQLQVPVANIQRIVQFILATKTHAPVPCDLPRDLSYFLDFDLSVLGSDPDTYAAYSRAIRQEYKQYPDFLYRSGRRKVLKSLLTRSTLYLTPEMQHRFGRQARINLTTELAWL
jgi:predicted metal-dependent HD superfamily phosphohydrolase